MKRFFSPRILSGSLLIASLSAPAQNLVLNPSFETVNAANLQCSWYTTQAQFNSAIANWTCPTGGSSDIFSSTLAAGCFCATNSTNASSYGSENPRTGNVMVGGSLYGSGGCTPYREYFQGALSAPLVPGTTYKIEFYVSLADNCQVGIDNIGLKFSNALVNNPTMCVFAAVPDVNYTGAPITTKNGWSKLEFCYTPTVANLQFFMIGNFFSNAATNTQNLAGTMGNAYYFLDDVSIMPSSGSTLHTATFASVCSSPTMTLSATPAGATYTWTPPAGATILAGANAQQATAQGSGVYTVTVVDPTACVVTPGTATVMATQAPAATAPTIAPAGTLTCSSPTLSLSANPLAGATYTWSGPGIASGGNGTNPVVNAPGIYTLTMTTGGCNSTATAAVTQNITSPVINLTPATGSITCTTPTVQLSAVLNPASSSYTWTTPSGGALSSATITNPVASGSGVFTITATNPANGCKASATTNLVPSFATVTLSVASASMCSGGSAALTVSGNAASYTWSPAASLNTSSGTAVVASPATSTTYTITGINGSCTGTTVATVTVAPLPVAAISPASQSVCQGQSTAMSASGAASYTWSPAASLNTANGASVTATPAATTVYSVTAEAGGCLSSTQATVTVLSNPSVTVSSNPAICAGSSATFTAQGAGSYTWSPATGLSTTTGSIVTASPAATTSYTVLGAVGTCTASSATTLTVDPLPVLAISPSQTICAGAAATMTVSGAGSYTWSPAASLNTASGASVSATPASATNYTVRGSSAAGCTNTISTSIGVNALPVLALTPVASTICAGDSVTINASGATSYTWSPAASLNMANGASVSASPGTTTSYTITGSANSCTASTQATVTVAPNPTVAIAGNTVICAGASTTLMAGGATNYTWSPATGLNTTLGAAVTAGPATNTSYTVTGSLGTCTAQANITVSVTPLPVLTISPSQTICTGDSASLHATGASSYSWSPASYLSSTVGASVTATPVSSISYTVTGTASACSSTLATSVQVNPLPALSVSPATPSLCRGSSATMSATGAGNYTWTPVASLNTGSGSNVVATPSVSTSYTVQGELAGCFSQTLVTVTVHQNPVLTISPSATICSGTSASLTVGGANTYTWNPMAGLTTSNGVNVTAAPAASSGYTVTGASAAGCTGTISVSVTVIPTPTLSAAAFPATICEGRTSALSATGASSYTWSPAASLSNINAGMADANPLATTVYSVTGSNGTSPNLCIATLAIEVSVTPTVNLVIPAVSPVCFGQTTMLEASGAKSYSWSPVQGVSSPNQGISQVKPSATTVYTVTASNGNACTSQGTVEVVVNPLPHVYAGADTTVNVDEPVTLRGTGDVPVEFIPNGSMSFNCNFCDRITVNPQEKTCYTLRGTTAAGCVAYDEVCVMVTKDWNVYIPNAFTPNGDGDNDTFMPQGYGLSQIRLWIFDRWGTQIFAGDENSPGWDGKLKGRLCEQGVYIYQVEIKTMAGNTIKKTGHVSLLGVGAR